MQAQKNRPMQKDGFRKLDINPRWVEFMRTFFLLYSELLYRLMKILRATRQTKSFLNPLFQIATIRLIQFMLPVAE